MGERDREPFPREKELIRRVRALTAGLPEVRAERDGFGHTTFRVGKRSFVMIGGGHGDGSMSIKADLPSQSFLVRRGPYERTPYIGQHGWVSVWGHQELDWTEIAELIRDAYRLVAPKRLLRTLDP